MIPQPGVVGHLEVHGDLVVAVDDVVVPHSNRDRHAAIEVLPADFGLAAAFTHLHATQVGPVGAALRPRGDRGLKFEAALGRRGGVLAARLPDVKI